MTRSTVHAAFVVIVSIGIAVLVMSIIFPAHAISGPSPTAVADHVRPAVFVEGVDGGPAGDFGATGCPALTPPTSASSCPYLSSLAASSGCPALSERDTGSACPYLSGRGHINTHPPAATPEGRDV